MHPLKTLSLILVGLVPPALAFAIGRKRESGQEPAQRDTRLQPPVQEAQPQPSAAERNVRAFLLMIQFAEGTYGPNAYRMLYGGTLFPDYSRHPNTKITKWGLTSTAAGAYQFKHSTWTEVAQKNGLRDFSPQSQDAGALALVKGKGALQDVKDGRIAQAIYKVRKVWASLPGAGYGQKEHSAATLVAAYQRSGGSLA